MSFYESLTGHSFTIGDSFKNDILGRIKVSEYVNLFYETAQNKNVDENMIQTQTQPIVSSPSIQKSFSSKKSSSSTETFAVTPKYNVPISAKQLKEFRNIVLQWGIY
jgi:hypothetical protein